MSPLLPLCGMLSVTQLNKATIIHQWLPGSTVAVNATANGYRVLWSTDGVWYLDGLKTTWETMYEQEPCTGIPDNLCDTLVLGGGGEMWWVGGEMCCASATLRISIYRCTLLLFTSFNASALDLGVRLWTRRTLSKPSGPALALSLNACGPPATSTARMKVRGFFGCGSRLCCMSVYS